MMAWTSPGCTGPDVPLVTERLLLRPYLPVDLPAFVAMNGDPDTMRYLGGPITASESETLAADINQCFSERGYGKIAMARRDTGQFIGLCGLSREVWFPDDLEIGWRLVPEARGHGFATEAARFWLAYGFDALGLSRMISMADVPNFRSIAVMQRLGMHYDRTETLTDDGETFEAVIYSITSAQFVR